MTPIERVRQRAEAASRLNVSLYSTDAQLRNEFRRRVFQTHPDRNQGNDAAFRMMKQDFELLARGAQIHVEPSQPAPTSDFLTPPLEAEARPTRPAFSAGGIRPRRVVSAALKTVERPKD